MVWRKKSNWENSNVKFENKAIILKKTMFKFGKCIYKIRKSGESAAFSNFVRHIEV